MNATFLMHPEPTLQDVIEVVQTGFGQMEGQMRGMAGELRELTRRVGNLEVKACDLDDNLTAIAEAFDKDAVTLLNHETRIVRLEKAIPA